MKKFGVLGSGDVGRTLAAGLHKHGYDVRIGTRTAGKLDEFARSTGITAGTFAEAVAWADVVVLAVKGAVAEVTVRQFAGPLFGKLVIDTTNPIEPAPPEDNVLRFFTSPNVSLLERLQRAAPEARFVKAFNCVGHELMVNPSFAEGMPTMFYCGNDAGSKAIVARVIEQFGWEPFDMGSAKAARAIEPLCQLWLIPALRDKSRHHAFKLLR